MDVFELVIGLLFVGGLLALAANRVGMPYPALLALVGAILALVPGTPDVRLDPELALALFVAPALLDSAYDASPRDLRRNIVPVVSLAVGMVIVTVAAVAWTVRAVVPDMGWATAIALGAIVAPSDASAASAVLRRLSPPHRLLVILEGESLFNDASALLIFRAAVGAAMTGAFSGWSILPMLVLTCVGGAIAGFVLAHVLMRLLAHVEEIAIQVLFGFIATFGVWMLADRAGLSAILTLVVFAMTLARNLSAGGDARVRITSYAFWEVAVLVLNVLAFVLIGMQLRGIVSRVPSAEWHTYATAAVSVSAAVIVARIVWVMSHTTIDRWREPRDIAPTYGSGFLAAWCGMRGIVTLAAALALPIAFPYRDLVVFCAFCVVLTTLVLQGLTLRPLMRWLNLHDDGAVQREVRDARVETTLAALKVLEGQESASARMLRSVYEARLHRTEAAGGTDDHSDDESSEERAIHDDVIAAQRQALRDLRARRVIGDDALHVLEQEIDALDLAATANHPS
jgi:Na+/H+ antiporter